MKKIIFAACMAAVTLFTACKKNKPSSNDSGYGNGPRTEVPASLKGNWMFGNFSMTEYWSQNPADYLGNALQYAFAFRFNSNGTYEQYFTSSSVSGGVTTYQQSVTKGTVEVDEENDTITTHAYSAHYKRTRNGQTVEERDLAQNELTITTGYAYTMGEENGTRAIYLTLDETDEPLTFLQKF